MSLGYYKWRCVSEVVSTFSDPTSRTWRAVRLMIFTKSYDAALTLVALPAVDVAPGSLNCLFAPGRLKNFVLQQTELSLSAWWEYKTTVLYSTILLLYCYTTTTTIFFYFQGASEIFQAMCMWHCSYGNHQLTALNLKSIEKKFLPHPTERHSKILMTPYKKVKNLIETKGPVYIGWKKTGWHR